MRNISQLAILLFPLLFFTLLVIFSDVRGPFYLGSNIDPSYAYLFNSLSVSEDLPVGHLDHPGTTVQSAGALVIKSVNFINRNPEIISAVLKNPEFYLNNIFLTFAAVNTSLLLIISVISFHLTKKIWISLILAMTPFFSLVVFASNLSVMPEPLLLTSNLLLILSLIILFFTDKHQKLIVLLFILSIGIGVASKITFSPLILIPLISLSSIKAKLSVALGSIFGFYIFTIPIIPFYSQLYNWIKGLFFHSGIHGRGENDIINRSTYFANIVDLLKNEPIFSIVLLAAIIILIIGFRSRVKNHHRKQLLILFSLIIAQIVQILMVAKHPGSVYLIPALNLSSVTLIFIITIFKQFKHNIIFFKELGLIMITLIFFGFLFTRQTQEMTRYYFNLQKNNSSLTKISQFVEKESNQAVIITYFRSSSKYYAMRFGNTFSRDAYSAYLSNIYSDVYFWDIWNARFSDWSSRIVDMGEIAQKGNNKKIIFHGTSFDKHYSDYPNYKPKLPLKDLLNGEEETAYQVLVKNL